MTVCTSLCGAGSQKRKAPGLSQASVVVTGGARSPSVEYRSGHPFTAVCRLCPFLHGLSSVLNVARLPGEKQLLALFRFAFLTTRLGRCSSM